MKNPTLFLLNVSIGVSLVAGLFNWKYFDYIFKILIAQLAFALTTQVIGIVFNNLYNNNTVVFNVYLFFDLGLVGGMGLMMIKEKMLRIFLLTGMLVCTLIDVLCIWKTGFSTFANWGYISASILFTVAYLFIFVAMLFNKEPSSLVKNPRFWVCIGILVYHGSTVPIFGFIHYLIEYHSSIAARVYYINDLLAAVRYACMFVAIILMRNQKRNSLAAKPVSQ